MPSFGGGVGVEVGLGFWPVALQLRATHVLGGEVDYLILDPDEEVYVEHSGSTTSSQVTFGVTYRFW